MATTNKTANLGLSQWEGTDALSREDLNSDLRKIDEGIGRVRLIDKTVTSQTASVQISLSSIDLEKFAEIIFYIDSSEADLCMRINGNSGKNYHCTYFDGYSLEAVDKIRVAPHSAHIFLGRARHYVWAEIRPWFTAVYKDTFPQLNYVNFFHESNVNFEEGDRITVWGVMR